MKDHTKLTNKVQKLFDSLSAENVELKRKNKEQERTIKLLRRSANQDAAHDKKKRAKRESVPKRFSPKSDLECEGYWSDEYEPNVTIGADTWDKAKFLSDVERVERKLQRSKGHYALERGLAPSRLESGVVVGNGEFVDTNPVDKKKICWPQGYAKHYIEKHNIAPTRRFYDYIEAQEGAAAGDKQTTGTGRAARG